MAALLLKVKYIKSLGGAERSLRYIAFGSKDVRSNQDRCTFDARSDSADVKRFAKELSDPLTTHPQAPTAFHMIVSLKRRDFNQAAMRDWREVVRETMRSYEVSTGRKLTWIASHHDNAERPHVHVMVKAVYQTRTSTRRTLRLYKQDIAQFKEIVGNRLEARGLVIDQYGLQRGGPLRDGLVGPTYGVLQAVRAMLDRIRQRTEEERLQREWEEEMERRKSDRGR